MNCACHGAPCYWYKDARKTKGGYWVCSVRKREHARKTDTARRAVKTARQRDRYDRDPIYRIEKNLSDTARRRRLTIERRRASIDGGSF